jgi:hypothetical protein
MPTFWAFWGFHERLSVGVVLQQHFRQVLMPVGVLFGPVLPGGLTIGALPRIIILE